MFTSSMTGAVPPRNDTQLTATSGHGLGSSRSRPSLPEKCILSDRRMADFCLDGNDVIGLSIEIPQLPSVRKWGSVWQARVANRHYNRISWNTSDLRSLGQRVGKLNPRQRRSDQDSRQMAGQEQQSTIHGSFLSGIKPG